MKLYSVLILICSLSIATMAANANASVPTTTEEVKQTKVKFMKNANIVYDGLSACKPLIGNSPYGFLQCFKESGGDAAQDKLVFLSHTMKRLLKKKDLTTAERKRLNYQINWTRSSLDDVIKSINREIAIVEEKINNLPDDNYHYGSSGSRDSVDNIGNSGRRQCYSREQIGTSIGMAEQLCRVGGGTPSEIHVYGRNSYGVTCTHCP